MFTGHDGRVAMNVYWSVAIFTSDQTSGPVESSPPVLTIGLMVPFFNFCKKRQKMKIDNVHCPT